MADSEDLQPKHSEVLEAPVQAPGGKEEGLVNQQAVEAGTRRQEAATEGAAGKTTAFTVLAEASRGQGIGESGEMDEELEGVPAYPAGEEEEEDEDWQFTLPKGMLEEEGDIDDDMDGTRPTKEEVCPSLSGIGQPCEKETQFETASGPANTSSSPVSSDGPTVAQSKELDASQMSKEPPAPETPPILSIKDEPMDEGYEQALLPQSSISKIKEELEHKEEELRISSVFSFRGGNAFAPQGGSVQFIQPPTIFIPSRATLLQAPAVAPLTLKPRLPAPALAPASSLALARAPASVPTLLPVPRPLSQSQPQPAPMSTIRCSGCSKVLVKGQTAFQRKGASQLFCSTVCLSSHLPPTSKARSCYQCNKEISDPKSMVMVPIDNNTFMHFCSHLCLSVSTTDRKKTVAQLLYSPRIMPNIATETDKLLCIMCKSTSKIEHEVMHQGRVHSLCNDACFLAWRKSRQLAMNCCEGCGLYCKSDSDVCQTLTVDKAQLHFCSPTCVSTYKQSCMKNTECTVCHSSVPVSNTIMEPNPMGKVQLYCSSTCVGQKGLAKHTLTGAAFPCSQCELNKVPQYHLATADGVIRNFCSYECVSVFRLKKEESSSQPSLVNGASSSPSYSPSQPSLTDQPPAVPVGGAESPVPAVGKALPLVAYPSPHHSVTSVPPLEPTYSNPASQAHLAPPSSPGHTLTQATPSHRSLTCHQCSKQFDTKPLLFSYQGCISMFCQAACCEQYKSQKNIMAQCDSCKLDNVVFEVVTFNQQERVFCSQSCKQQFQSEVTVRSKGSWRPCSYCSCVSQERLYSHYSGHMEEFCRPGCMSKFTVLYYGMARCDGCRKQGYMTERLQCTNSVRNFCTPACMQQYCYQHFETRAQRSAEPPGGPPALPPPHAPSQAHHPSKMDPGVGDVVSLASDSAAQPHGALTGTLLTSSKAHDKTVNHASTQTEAMRVPSARRCQVKNKSVLCRPFTLNQETMCQLLEPPANTSDASTDVPQLPQVPLLPARLSGRHFLDVRRGGSLDCVVCSHHKRQRVIEEQEEEHVMRKRGRMEKAQEEESGQVRAEETKKVKEEEEAMKQQQEEKQQLKDKKQPDEEECTEEKVRGETSNPAQKVRCSERREKHEEVKSETGAGETRRPPAYCCKTCPGQPTLCAVPCFELYHTQFLYWVTAQLETARDHRTPYERPNTARTPCDPTRQLT